MNPTVYLAYPGMKVPVRRIPVYHYKLATEQILDFEIVADDDAPTARFACDQAGWLELSTDGGFVYDPIPDDAEAGIDFGPLTAGDRESVKLKLDIPALTAVRSRFIALNFGMGVD